MSLASGDVDGDRKPELVIGVPFHPDGSLMAGSAYVLKGGALGSGGNLSLANPGAGNYRIDGAKTQDGAGWSVATSPDLNGDGIGDVLLGAPGVDRPSGPTLKGVVRRSRRRLRGVRLQDPVERGARHADRQGSAADGRRRLALGRPGRLERRGPRRHGANGVNVAAVGVPGYDTTGNQTSGVGTGRDKGHACLLNGRHRCARADDLDHVAARRRADPEGHAGRAGVLLRRPDRRLLHRDRPRRGDRQRRECRRRRIRSARTPSP